MCTDASPGVFAAASDGSPALYKKSRLAEWQFWEVRWRERRILTFAYQACPESREGSTMTFAFTLMDAVGSLVISYVSGLMFAMFTWEESREYRTPNIDGNRGVAVIAKLAIYSVYWSVLGWIWMTHVYATEMIPAFIRWIPRAAKWLVKKQGGAHL